MKVFKIRYLLVFCFTFSFLFKPKLSFKQFQTELFTRRLSSSKQINALQVFGSTPLLISAQFGRCRPSTQPERATADEHPSPLTQRRAQIYRRANFVQLFDANKRKSDFANFQQKIQTFIAQKNKISVLACSSLFQVAI